MSAIFLVTRGTTVTSGDVTQKFHLLFCFVANPYRFDLNEYFMIRPIKMSGYK